MTLLGGDSETVVLNCPSCAVKVAVPSAARGRMAKCVACSGTFPIPMDGEPSSSDEALADDIAFQVLDETDQTDEATVVMESLQDEDDEEEGGIGPPKQLSPIEQAESLVDLDPPDIGDVSTPAEVKQLRRERHALLLEVGRYAHLQILSSSFGEFQNHIKRADKTARRIRAWLEAVERTGSDDNPLAKRVDMNVDPTKATKQLAEAIERHNHAFRVLAEAMITFDQHPTICPDQRVRIREINAKLDELLPLPSQKKGLLSRLRGDS